MNSLEGRQAAVVQALREFDFVEENMPQAVRNLFEYFQSLARYTVNEIEDSEGLVSGLHHLVQARDCFVEGATGNTLFVESVEGREYLDRNRETESDESGQTDGSEEFSI